MRNVAGHLIASIAKRPAQNPPNAHGAVTTERVDYTHMSHAKLVLSVLPNHEVQDEIVHCDKPKFRLSTVKISKGVVHKTRRRKRTLWLVN